MQEEDSYTATIDSAEFDGDSMTDLGIRVQDLLPIEDCMLTPGDPSPIGRSEDGDLAYLINPKKLNIQMSATTAASLVVTLAASLGITDIKAVDTKNDMEYLLLMLVNECLPRVMFDDSAHGEIAWTGARETILSQGPKALPLSML